MFRLLLVGQGFTFLDRFEDCGVDFAGVSFVGFDFPGDLFLASQEKAKIFDGSTGLIIKEWGILRDAWFTSGCLSPRL